MDVEQFHNLIWYLISAIEDHAIPRDYDWWVLRIASVGTIIAGVSTLYAVRLYKGQMKIIREQNAISEQQNDIALFDKKYELLKEIKDVKKNMYRTKRFYTKEAFLVDKENDEDIKDFEKSKEKSENPRQSHLHWGSFPIDITEAI